MDNFDYPGIGQRIKQLRKRKGLNQTELAQMIKSGRGRYGQGEKDIHQERILYGSFDTGFGCVYRVKKRTFLYFK